MAKRARRLIGVFGIVLLTGCGGQDSTECEIDADCDDGNACTVGTCGDDGACTFPELQCDDGSFCNGQETCDTTLGCQPGTQPTVDDGIGCTTDSCDEDNDVVINAPDDSVCDNGMFCDGPETCDVDNDCQAGTPPAIDDGVMCTNDFCNEIADTVVHAVDHTTCDNDLFCDGQERCDPVDDCQPGSPPTIDDGVMCTDDSCDETNDVVINAVNDNNCDNDMFCDGVETCSAIMDCVPGTPPVTDDGVMCTNDSCDEDNDMVVNTADDTNCDDGIACTGDTCDAMNDCQYASTEVYDNGAADLVDGFASSDWAADGVMDDFSFPGIGGATDFCTARITMVNLGVPTTQFQEMRVRVYALGAGGMSALGDFSSIAPVYDATSTVASGDLEITDTESDLGPLDIVEYSAHAAACVDLGAGDFALHITFPDWTSQTGFWLTAPQTGGMSGCAHDWGTSTATPQDACATGGAQYENLSFRLLNPQ